MISKSRISYRIEWIDSNHRYQQAEFAHERLTPIDSDVLPLPTMKWTET
jgi:hypothetical protein